MFCKPRFLSTYSTQNLIYLWHTQVKCPFAPPISPSHTKKCFIPYLFLLLQYFVLFHHKLFFCPTIPPSFPVSWRFRVAPQAPFGRDTDPVRIKISWKSSTFCRCVCVFLRARVSVCFFLRACALGRVLCRKRWFEHALHFCVNLLI